MIEGKAVTKPQFDAVYYGGRARLRNLHQNSGFGAAFLGGSLPPLPHSRLLFPGIVTDAKTPSFRHRNGGFCCTKWLFGAISYCYHHTDTPRTNARGVLKGNASGKIREIHILFAYLLRTSVHIPFIL